MAGESGKSAEGFDMIFKNQEKTSLLSDMLVMGCSFSSFYYYEY